ncbi:MAG TPA: heavy metal-associated domain-containing protein [Bdellovibrionales bacterium]|nr:heavy metal-associated domain-containing protein [Bdellovibrionales bacterium]
MKILILAALLTFGGFASAEETTCTVKGMHCQGCTESVEGKVCDENKYKTCEIKIIDAKKQIGQIRVEPKDAKANVDEKAISALVKDAGYEMQNCKKSKTIAEPKAKG